MMSVTPDQVVVAGIIGGSSEQLFPSQNLAKEWSYQTATEAEHEDIHFVPGTTEVRPDLDREYDRHLKATGYLEELAHFANVKD
ncbi:hypothetical protein [Lactiplantibacillus plantarum]|uniref:hypothetical protein n=1 Tax=Lactiplantibacillus plantarum TaxID=1590 RepID=UPI000AF6D82F|nr:hypothetical protein [Lactiplantibacillus plantarum]MCG0575640.1 transcription regulator, MerR family [Lactiplantibacillus plantarum]MCG0733139.1 transcription regulator, MerR family [Lactiplantibacillus plantarum]